MTPTDNRLGRFSAVNLRSMGLFPFPLADPSTEDPRQFKKPRHAGWREIARTSTRSQLRFWDAEGWNLGLYLISLVVMDSDTPEAETWAAGNLPESPWMTKTAQGRHRFSRRPEGMTVTDNKPYPGLDRKANGYVLAPGSWHFTANREYLPEGDWNAPMDALPMYDPAWFPVALAERLQANRGIFPQLGNHPDIVRRASLWLARVPAAVTGQGGHLQTFKAAMGLVRGFCLDEGTALHLLFNEFNPRCEPAWSLAELRRKVEQAQTSHVASGSDGWLLNARRSA